MQKTFNIISAVPQISVSNSLPLLETTRSKITLKQNFTLIKLAQYGTNKSNNSNKFDGYFFLNHGGK